jgi:hypothetical protein
MYPQTDAMTCPGALELKRILHDSDPAELDELLVAESPDQLAQRLKSKGIDLSLCDRVQVLQVIRDAIAGLTDEDLAMAAGGEIAKTTKAVLTATAVAGSVVAVGVAGGIAGGTVAAAMNYNASHS